MKNTFWNIIFFALTGMIVTSCSGNNDDAEPIVGGDGVAPTVNGKQLVRIKHGDSKIDFVYNSDGRLIKVKQSDNQYESSYCYESKRIIQSPLDYIYNMNNGHIVECNYTILPSLEENAHSIDVKETYEYDSNGHLIEFKRPSDYTVDGYSLATFIYSWQNGNITKITESTEETEYTAGGVWAKLNISYTSYANTIPFFFVGFGYTDVYLSWQGFFGKRCKNLPASQTFTYISEQWGDNIKTDTITYTYDYAYTDGLVTNVTSKRTYKGNTSIDVYDLEWW